MSELIGIRHTSATNPTQINAIRDQDTNAQLLNVCLSLQIVRWLPSAATEFGIAKSDRSGFSGANFIVEWVFESGVSNPVAEAIMITA